MIKATGKLRFVSILNDSGNETYSYEASDVFHDAKFNFEESCERDLGIEKMYSISHYVLDKGSKIGVKFLIWEYPKGEVIYVDSFEDGCLILEEPTFVGKNEQKMG